MIMAWKRKYGTKQLVIAAVTALTAVFSMPPSTSRYHTLPMEAAVKITRTAAQYFQGMFALAIKLIPLS
jgi:hypothetical protein